MTVKELIEELSKLNPNDIVKVPINLNVVDDIGELWDWGGVVQILPVKSTTRKSELKR